jgi:hypothetical protein
MLDTTFLTSSNMRLTSLLFSSKGRVYNLRLLILVNVGSLVAQLVWTHQSLEANPSDEREFIDKHRLNYSAPFAIPGFVLVHHTLA